jgi:hypothetical protein
MGASFFFRRDMKIESGEQLKNMMLDQDAPKGISERVQFDHMAIANQAIKLINGLNVDWLVKKVVTLRIMAPIGTGRGRTHSSIALELGVSEKDVIQAEEYGKQVMFDAMNRTDLQEIIDKHNLDRAAEDAMRTVVNP